MNDTLSHLVWREPAWLWLALYPWVIWTLRAFLDRQGAGDYADPHLMPWARARAPHGSEAWRLWRHGALAAAWLLFAMALAGPRVAEGRFGHDRAEMPQLMVVLDVSRSMTARDVAPDRLARARLELHDLIARTEGYALGLVVYAGRPHLMVPPTNDKNALRFYLDAVRYGVLPTAGSNLQDAVEFATSRFTSGHAPRALLLVTDGEMADDAAAALEPTLAELHRSGISLYVLGVGTPEGAGLPTAQGGWLRDGKRPLIAGLHSERLRRFARLGGGRYAEISDTDGEWRELYDAGLRHLTTRGSRKDDGLTVWRELYGWFLAPGLLLLLLAHTNPARRAHSVALVLVLATQLVPPVPAHAADDSAREDAYTAYAHHSFAEARRLYAHVAGYVGRMGEGSSAYRLGDYTQAVQLFTQAVLDADNDAQRADALLNLANSRFKLGDFRTAAQTYRDVLRYRAHERAARVNLGYALALAEQRRRSREATGPARQGRGPRSAIPPEGTDVTSGRLRLSDQRPPTGTSESEPAPGTGAEPGIGSSRPAVDEQTEFTDTQWQYAETSAADMIRKANTLQVDQSVLWKRIFETEEGFPAPEQQPQTLPGVPPW